MPGLCNHQYSLQYQLSASPLCCDHVRGQSVDQCLWKLPLRTSVPLLLLCLFTTVYIIIPRTALSVRASSFESCFLTQQKTTLHHKKSHHYCSCCRFLVGGITSYSDRVAHAGLMVLLRGSVVTVRFTKSGRSTRIVLVKVTSAAGPELTRKRCPTSTTLQKVDQFKQMTAYCVHIAQPAVLAKPLHSTKVTT